jgi:hypothetical protein
VWTVDPYKINQELRTVGPGLRQPTSPPCSGAKRKEDGSSSKAGEAIALPVPQGVDEVVS